jgi:site-specific DNA recombinase
MAKRRKPSKRQVGDRPIERVGIYQRVSTEEQAKEGYGLDAQHTRCTAMLTVKGWSNPTYYVDAGISGTKDASKRPALQRLMTEVRSGRVDAVIILSLDRLGRKTRLVLDLVDELTYYGVSLISCKESLDTTTPQGQFTVTLFAALAQLERDQISERTAAALAERGAIDGEKGGRLPYGYLRSDEGLLVDEAAAEVVRQIFLLRQHGVSLRAIAAGIACPSPRGGKWHPSSVNEILLNEEAYRGGTRGESAVRWQSIL